MVVWSMTHRLGCEMLLVSDKEIHPKISLALPMMPDSISDGVLWSILTL